MEAFFSIMPWKRMKPAYRCLDVALGEDIHDSAHVRRVPLPPSADLALESRLLGEHN